MLRRQLVVFVVFAAVMAGITALSYILTQDGSDCSRGFSSGAEACR
jgi:hypothetical protein